MPVRIRRRTRSLKTLLPRIERNFSRKVQREMGDAIVAEILAGKSPVRGKKFAPYSKPYAKRKRGSSSATRPVDMLDTGKMLESITIKRLKKGRISIFFDSVIAVYHDILGAGKSKVKRRLLPSQKGDQWNTKLTRLLNKLIEGSVRREVRR